MKESVIKPSEIQVDDFLLKPIPVIFEYAKQIFDAFHEDIASFQFWCKDGIYNTPDEVLKDYEKKYIDDSRWKYAMYGIFINNELLGEIGLSGIDMKYQTAEIGYWLKKSVRGKGIIRKLIPVIEKLAFDVYELRKIYIWCDTKNIASVRNAEKTGYILEGILREREIWSDGSIHSTAIYGKLKSEWKDL